MERSQGEECRPVLLLEAGTKKGRAPRCFRAAPWGSVFVVSFLAVLAWSLAPLPAEGQEGRPPVDVQASLFSRIVQFDRSFDARSADGLVVAILFQENLPASVNTKDEFSKALQASGFLDAKGLPPRIVEVQPGEGLGPALESAGVDLLYMAPVRGIDLGEVSLETRRLGILSCSSVTDSAQQGLSVELDFRESRPRILVNLPAAEAESADFRPGLLKMAEIIWMSP